MHARRFARAALLLAFLTAPLVAAPYVGYYRHPALHGDTVVFVAEGDLWTVPIEGGMARRLTSHPGHEEQPAISPDGTLVAFTGEYEGPKEVYTMPLAGGRPTRRTYGAERIAFVGWTPSGAVLYSTRTYSTLPSYQLVSLDISRPDVAALPDVIPLAQAADGTFDPRNDVLYFTRQAFQGSHTKRYKGGTAQAIWTFAPGADEAVPLTPDYAGTSRRPMWFEGRVYFASDRDGTMNLWSMRPDGSDPQQHTRHDGWDVKTPALHGGRIAYQCGADVYVYDIAAGDSRVVPITLPSDFDQTRENWVDKPMDYLTAAHIAPDGEHVVLTARGQVFVAPRRLGRFAQVSHRDGVRHRGARFLPGTDRLLTLSDASGEVEVWTLPANGVGEPVQLTNDGNALRWEALPSPNGKYVAHHDKEQRLFLLDVATGANRQIDASRIDQILDMTWSADSGWLAYGVRADNMFTVVKLHRVADASTTTITTDRFDSYSPRFSPDGDWLYLLSDRNLKSLVDSPWGSYAPEPFLDKRTKVYQLALRDGLRSPFAPPNELEPANDEGGADEPAAEDREEKATETPPVEIELEHITARLRALPVPAGNYSELAVNDAALFWLSSPTGKDQKHLVGLEITNDEPKVTTLVEDVQQFELSQDGQHILLRKGDTLYVIEAAVKEADLSDAALDLSPWKLAVQPREEWRQMFVEAWRLERDYFYDPNMHGVDWDAMRRKYEPLIERVTSREELSDLIAQMVSELAALHIYVHGGDIRAGADDVPTASLGARLQRDEAGGGYRVKHIYQSDPDQVERCSPLARPNVNVAQGDIITMINGVDALSVADIGMLLRHQAGRQVRLRVKPGGGGDARDVIVRPIDSEALWDLRYHEWEYTRRLAVEEQSTGQIGYVHLRAMSGENYTEWARNYFPVYTRAGLIIDVRHNWGGNIDSWILSRLLRKVWFYWSQHAGHSPTWNMQYAFRGHVVVLCNEWTMSDGEAFTEGIKRLDLGTVIGTRTWGGEIWLSARNHLVDRGIATSAEFGVYGPEGEWLIEGHGVEPDIIVDNLPHATFNGEDAQLDAAIRYLQKKIEEEPVEIPLPPPHPDKSGR